MLIQIYPTISDVFERQQGKRVQDIWEFKDPQYPVYPTEKNIDFFVNNTGFTEIELLPPPSLVSTEERTGLKSERTGIITLPTLLIS